MATDPHVPRRYTDDEVGEILKRATDIQHREAPPKAGSTGLTLAELQEIAAEAGIDPRHLQRAAADLDSEPPSSLGTALAGAPLTVRVERVLPGEFDEQDFERLLPEIQQASAGHGNATMVGRTLTWSSETSQRHRSLQITVSSMGGETLVRAEERLHGLAGALYGGLVGGGGGGIGIGVGVGVGVDVLGSALFATVFPIAVAGGFYLIARQIMKTNARNRREVLERLVDRISEHMYSKSEQAALPDASRDALPPAP